MDHVEAAIVERVALLHPEVFAALDEFARHHVQFIDATLARFDREVQFYVAWLALVSRTQASGLSFCYPAMSTDGQVVEARAAFDLALAVGVPPQGGAVVTNDVRLEPPERILVVSGPNQGGKTTFARMVGQLHHLGRLGLLVPAAAARLPIADAIYTHFERQEEVEDLASKLEQDLLRIRDILALATARSVVIMNESFTSTTVDDQLVVGRRVLERLIERGPVCVVVTFLDELASLGPATVSMVGTVDPDEPARRTFRVVRRSADGLAYALAIAERHRVTYRHLKERLTA